MLIAAGGDHAGRVHRQPHGDPAPPKPPVAPFTTGVSPADDPAFVSLLQGLREGCPEFEGWWERHDLRRPSSGRKTLHHPARGVIAFDHISFQANDEPGLKLVIYTPAPVAVA